MAETRAKNSTQKGDKGNLSTAQTDREAIKAATRYQQNLLGSYLPTQQQTVAQNQQLLAGGVSRLADVAKKNDSANRLAELQFLRQYGVQTNRAGRNADPETQALYQTLQQRYAQPTQLGAELNQEALAAQPSQLSHLLDAQAQEQLRLGGSLSSEEIRQSEQASRGAWADRGLQFSNPAIVSEALNRTSMSDARLAGRQQLGMAVNQQLLGEQQQNHGFQLGVQQGQQAGDAQTQELIRLRESTSPVDKLLSRGTNTGMLLGAGQANLNAGTFGASALTGYQDQYAGYLMNRDASQQIADTNAAAGMQTASSNAKASASAGNKQLIGAGVGAAAVVAGAIIIF